MGKLPRKSAFTLVEMMVAIGIVLVLTSITFAVASSAMDGARVASEMAAARTIISAYTSATAENDGLLPVGYDDKATGYTMPNGSVVSAAAAHRYPLRLAPYFGFALDGTILVNRNKWQVGNVISLASRDYAASLYPALGMNLTYVGGRLELGVLDKKLLNECATRMGQVSKPSSMLVFASAGRGSGKEKIDGWFELEPPNTTVKLWGSDEDGGREDLAPGNHGNVDFRYKGRAVCAFLDGSIRMLVPKDLADMRLWNRNAQDQDNPDYKIAVSGPPTGRGGGR